MKTLQKLLMLLAAVVSLAASAGTVTYYHNDLAGSPMVATNASGQVIWREDYRPYGERLTSAAAAAADNKVWFTSRRQDPETGLVYMGARFYDPVAGRFISKDPVHFVEDNVHSFNRYAYANNNPYKFKDPDGRAADFVWDLASFSLSVGFFKADPTLSNFVGAAVDGVALAVPFVPGGVGTVRATAQAAEHAASSIERQAADLVAQNGGKSRVTLRSENQRLDIDLIGKDHNGIATPHTKVSPRNHDAPNQPAYNTSESNSTLRPASQDDIRTARRYLDRRPP